MPSCSAEASVSDSDVTLETAGDSGSASIEGVMVYRVGD